MELSLFQENNIKLLWHESENIALNYDQVASPFNPNLSILDMFFNIGYEKSAALFNSK